MSTKVVGCKGIKFKGQGKGRGEERGSGVAINW